MWSPDGTKVAFQSNRDGNEEIYLMNADGTSQSRLTNNSAGDNQPSWSPDGTKIAFYSNRDGSDGIYVMDAGGTNQIRLSSNSTFDAVPSWSPFFPAISLSGTSLSFGNVAVSSSVQQTFTVSNTGTVVLNVTGITVTGTDAAQFSVNPASFNLSAGVSQTVTVTFAPTSTGAKSGTLSITHNATGSPSSVSLSGTGVAPDLQIAGKIAFVSIILIFRSFSMDYIGIGSSGKVSFS